MGSIVLEDLHFTVDICNCMFCVTMVGKNDTLQLLLDRHYDTLILEPRASYGICFDTDGNGR